MSYTVTMLDTETNEERSRDFVGENYQWPRDEFWWTEGNMGCDCNRADFLDVDDGHHPCNVGLNRFLLIQLRIWRSQEH